MSSGPAASVDLGGPLPRAAAATAFVWEAMESLTVAAARVFNLEADVFALRRQLDAFCRAAAGSGAPLSALTFPVCCLRVGAPGGTVELTPDEAVQVKVCVPHARLVGRLCWLKEALSSSEPGLLNTATNDGAVTEDLGREIAQVASLAAELEILVVAVVAEWRALLRRSDEFSDAITEDDRVAILQKFVVSLDCH